MRIPLILALVALAAAVPYAGLLGPAGFVSSLGLDFAGDDHRFITENPAVTDPPGLGRFFLDPTTADPEQWQGIWRPLRTLDYALDWWIAGRTPPSVGTALWFHARNVLLHVAAAVLAVTLFLRWGAGRNAALLGGLVFALHPVQVEAVSYVSARGDLLCAVFFLGALLLHSRSPRFGFPAAGAGLCLVLALLSKETAVVFLPAAFLADWFFRDGRKVRACLRRWPAYLLYGALTAAWGVALLAVTNAHGGQVWHVPGRWGGSLAGSFLMLGRGLAYYARLVLLPVDMSFDFYLREIRGADPLTVLCLLTAASVLVLAVVRAKRGGGAGAFAPLWFAVALFPASGLAVPLGIPTAERFLYLPLVGVALWAGGALDRFRRLGIGGLLPAVTLLACLGTVSFLRAPDFRTDASLWPSAMKRGASPRACRFDAYHLRLYGEGLAADAGALLDRGHAAEARVAREESRLALARAIELCDRAIAMWARLPAMGETEILRTRAERALSLYALNRHQEALDDADAAVRGLPGMPDGHYARSLALLGLGRARESAEEIEVVLRSRRTAEALLTAAGIYEKFAIEYEARGNRAWAYRALRRSWDLYHDPDGNRGVRRSLDAMESDRTAREEAGRNKVRANPSDGDAWLELAVTYAQYGELSKAGPIFEDLLARAKGEARRDVMFNYALYYWQWRDTPEGYRAAAALYEEILREEPGLTQVKEQLRICRDQLGGR